MMVSYVSFFFKVSPFSTFMLDTVQLGRTELIWEVEITNIDWTR